MTDRPGHSQRFIARLGFQMAFLLAVVLLPLTLISVLNSMTAFNEMEARAKAALTGATTRAAAPVVQLIQEARGAASALALAIRPNLDDIAACTDMMRGLQIAEPRYALVAYVPLNGQMRCSSYTEPLDFTLYPFFESVTAEPRPAFSVNYHSPVWPGAVLGVSHPVFNDIGHYVGVIYLSLPQSSLQIATAPSASAMGDQVRPLDVVTYDRQGEVLTTTGNLENLGEKLPRDRALSLLIESEPFTFQARSEVGALRIFSVVPLVPGEFFALGTWPADEELTLRRGITIQFLLPALTWVASLVAAWISVEWLVIRHIRKLGTSIQSFARGDRTVVPIEIGHAPQEIRDMVDAYEHMTEAVIRNEAELEDTVHQKEVLVREVHHRVKNNLQLIVSILNMQMRRAQTPEIKFLTKGMLDRVMSLATVHGYLYQTVGLTDVHAGKLLASITRQIISMSSTPGHRFELETQFDDLELTPDQAVPLALLMAEALTNALKYATPGETGVPRLEVRLVIDGSGTAALKVANTVAGHATLNTSHESTDAPRGLGSQLLTAFAQQLGGHVERDITNGVHTLRVAFVPRPLTEAEARYAGAQEAADDET